MKYLLLIAVIGLVFFMLGLKSSGRAAPPPGPRPPAPPPPAAPQDIVSCQHCGLHVPRGEAFPGRGGLFCSAAHRAAHEAGQAS